MANIKKIENNNAAELRAAEQAVGSDSVLLDEQPDGMYTHKFAEPIQYDGKTFDKLTFDFDSLTGGDSLDVESELLSKGHAVVVRTIDGEYLSRMCARACTESVGADIFRHMKVKDYGQITNVAKRFF